MKILKANAGALTNFEVLDFLRSRNAAKDPVACLGSVSPSECKVFDFLEHSVSCNQTRESINTFIERCQKYGLAPAEKLNIINLRPTTPVEVFAIIESADSRLGDADLEELTELVAEVLPPGPSMIQEEECN